MKKYFTPLIFTFFIFSFSLVAFGQKEPLYFAQTPALSPDAETTYFSYDGDLWKVATQGGTAERITGMRGQATHPRVSPDGKWIAFSSNQYGNNDVYIMPVEGGDIQQLTFHEAGDVVSSWSWDSQWIYFTSDRKNRVSTYKVNIHGGTPQRIFGHYFNTIHDLFPDPKTGELFFNYSWESYSFATRKGYKGPYNPDIQSYNPKTKEYKKYTDWKGKDFNVSIDRNGNRYFISDEENGQHNLYTFKGDKKTPLTHFDEMVIHPFVSADGSTVVFEKDYQLWKYDVASGKASEIPIKGYRNNTLSKFQSFNVKGNISAFDIAPDQKKIAFVSKGKLFVSDSKGKFIKELQTLPGERVLEVNWLKDNKTLVYNQTWKGYTNWFSQTADGKGQEKQLTKDQENNRRMTLGPKKEKAVYLKGRNDVMVMDLETFSTQKVASDEIWGFENDQPQFSPDGKYVMFTARRNFEKDIMLCRLSDGKVYNLTQTGVTEANPVFSRDGKDLYFVSDRTEVAYPYGLQNPHLYRIPLSRETQPFRSTEFDELFAGKKDDTDKNTKKKKSSVKKKLPQMKIDFEDMMSRATQIGPRQGRQQSVFLTQDGEKQVLLFTSNHEGRYALYQLDRSPFERDKTHKIDMPMTWGGSLVEAGGKVYALVRGTIYSLNLKAHKAKKIEFQDFNFQKNLERTFQQMFNEVWANLEENYYNETFNGADWQAVHDRYVQYLPHVQSRADLRRLLKDMMGELNTSHYGFTSFGREETTYYHTYTAEPGLIFAKDNPYKVEKIVPKGPADYENIAVRPGDILVAVNGKKIETQKSRETYFAFPKRPTELSMTFKSDGKEKTVKVHPESYSNVKTQLYNDWIAQNARKVSRESEQKIGYVYMKDMSAGSLQKFMQDMVKDSVNRDGLIVDLRYNTGGNVHGKVLDFLAQRPYLQWKYRQGKMSPQPDFAPAAKPIVLLVNEQTLSDGEMTAAGFQALKLGTVLGTGTYHWIIFTSSKSLVDGSSYRLPSWGCYTLDGQNLEKVGVTPDVFVKNTFTDRLEGKDPQLERAVELIMQQLK